MRAPGQKEICRTGFKPDHTGGREEKSFRRGQMGTETNSHQLTITQKLPTLAHMNRLASRYSSALFLLCHLFGAGIAHAASSGTVVAWGFNGYGQTTIPIAAQSGITAIGSGGYHTVALKIDGSVVAWGWGDYGQILVPVTAQSGVKAVAAGGSHTVALKSNGSVVAWGDNTYGQTTVPVAAQNGVAAIAAGEGHTVALNTNGAVVAWGRNNYGQATVPVEAQSGVAAIATKYLHTVALKTNGLSWRVGIQRPRPSCGARRLKRCNSNCGGKRSHRSS